MGLCERYERQCFEMYNKLTYYRKLLLEPKKDHEQLQQHLIKDKDRFEQQLFHEDTVTKQRLQLEPTETSYNHLGMKQVQRPDGKLYPQMANPFAVRTIGVPFYQDYWSQQANERDSYIDQLEQALASYKVSLAEQQGELKTLNNMYMAELSKNSQRKAVINVLKRHLGKLFGQEEARLICDRCSRHQEFENIQDLLKQDWLFESVEEQVKNKQSLLADGRKHIQYSSLFIGCLSPSTQGEHKLEVSPIIDVNDSLPLSDCSFT